MPYAREHKHQRVQVSSVTAPRRKDDRHHKRLVMAVGVTVAMVVIAGLYAASFPYQRTLREDLENTPRWGVLKSDLSDSLESAQIEWERITRVKDSLTAVIEAKRVQAKGLEILKTKIESATATPTTEN